MSQAKKVEFPISNNIRRKPLEDLLGKIQKHLSEMLPGSGCVNFDILRADYGEFVKIRLTVVLPDDD